MGGCSFRLPPVDPSDAELARRLQLAVPDFVAVLLRMYELGVSLRSPTRDGVERYLKWLPALLTDSPPIPTADVAWLWHLHKLAPACYQTYCKAQLGRVPTPPASLAFEFAQEQKKDEKMDEQIPIATLAAPTTADAVAAAINDIASRVDAWLGRTSFSARVTADAAVLLIVASVAASTLRIVSASVICWRQPPRPSLPPQPPLAP